MDESTTDMFAFMQASYHARLNDADGGPYYKVGSSFLFEGRKFNHRLNSGRPSAGWSSTFSRGLAFSLWNGPMLFALAMLVGPLFRSF